jgi:hypothetical protein
MASSVNHSRFLWICRPSPLDSPSVYTMLFLDLLQPLFPLFHLLFRVHLHLLNLMIQHDQIPIPKIEPIQFITCLFRVYHVFIHDVGGSLGGWGVAGADLADGTEFGEEVEEGGRVDVVGEVFDEEDAVGFGGEFGAGHVQEE